MTLQSALKIIRCVAAEKITFESEIFDSRILAVTSPRILKVHFVVIILMWKLNIETIALNEPCSMVVILFRLHRRMLRKRNIRIANE